MTQTVNRYHLRPLTCYIYLHVQYLNALDGVAELLPLLHCGMNTYDQITLWTVPLALWTVCHCWYSNCSTNGTACNMNFQLQIFLSLDVFVPWEGSTQAGFNDN